MIFSVIKRIAGVLLCFLLLNNAVLAQSSASSDLGSIPDSLFATNQYPPHPDVPFIYSLKKLHITFQQDKSSIIAVMKYHIRKKIFDSSDKRAALVGIPYYFANHIENVTDIRGYTYQNPKARVPLDSSNIRTINLNSRYNVKEFTMPNVQDGSVIDYTYTIRRRYIEELPDFYFSHQVPTKRAVVSITYPNYMRYKGAVMSYSGKVDHFFTRVDTSIHEPKIFNYPQPPRIVTETWRILNIPPVKKEKHISSLNDYRGKIKFQLSAFGKPRQPLINSWDFVVAKIRRDQQILKHIKVDSDAHKIGQNIAETLSGKKAMQDSIFRYLNQQSVYSGSKGSSSNESAKVVLNGKPSSQAAINQTLAAMLRGAGIKAYPLLISTRKAGRIDRSFPSFFQFNGQLVYSKIDGQSYFMDASFPHSRPNLIPVNTFSEKGLLLKPDSYKWVNIEPAKSAYSIKININAKLNKQGDLNGTIQAESSGYPAQKIRKKQASAVPPAGIIRQTILDGYSSVHLANTTIKDAKDDNSAVKTSSHFTLQHYAVTFKDGLQFRPMVVGYIENNPFDATKRQLPITLNAPKHLDLSYDIQIPAGMTLKEQPQDQTIRLPGAVLKERYDINEQTLSYEFHIDIYRKDFSADLYPRLLYFYQRWVQLSHTQWYVER